jgi:hypothetical protein
MFSLLSEKFKAMNKGEEEFRISMPNNYFSCFLAFLDIFKGLPFYFENYSFASLSYLIKFFGISSLFDFICANIPIPQNLQQSVEFLSHSSSEFIPQVFNESLNRVIQNLERIEIDQLLSLPNDILEKVFKSDQLQIEAEDYLFNLILELIKRDSNRKVLLKSVFYPGVSTSLLISYFKDFPVEEIDFDLFNSLKERIFSDVFLSDPFPSSNRWRNPPKSQSKKEVEQIYQMIF